MGMKRPCIHRVDNYTVPCLGSTLDSKVHITPAENEANGLVFVIGMWRDCRRVCLNRVSLAVFDFLWESRM